MKVELYGQVALKTAVCCHQEDWLYWDHVDETGSHEHEREELFVELGH